MGFALKEIKYRYHTTTENDHWKKGQIIEDNLVHIHEGSPALHYGQSLFEGLKAYRQKSGKVVLFRPDLNFERLNQGLKVLQAPEMSKELFMEAVMKTVSANYDEVPTYDSGQSMYVRPFVFGTGFLMGVEPAAEWVFRVMAFPVATYFGDQAQEFITTEFDRAAGNGTGHVKLGGNYAGGLRAQHDAKAAGFADAIFLDPLTHTKIDEAGTSNFIGVTKDNVFITPKSPSILPSITRKSLLYLAKHYLKMEVQERDIYIDQLDELKEAGACGTAAVLAPISAITHQGKRHQFGDGKAGPVMKKLRQTLIKIHLGEIEAPEGWIVEIKKGM